MKNLKITAIALFLGAFVFSSCGPSLCDCVNGDPDDKDLEKKCKEKYEPAKDASKEDLEDFYKKVEECQKEKDGEKKDEEKKEE
ncbi:MAG: hypothetical protein A2W91_03615 [Bacteroidetes bacterium GWF2_38_335]|nr:MAG: hypothetical protein A2W91_03615 [Bacteroidetes bacterium GWF2_38_335]OFY77428.1 MAG: hypothetical protein A2281_01145 [Bacteroidetes bacterium RIFOXYA12_FULL_38_20]HBS87283.1 hypothetical protein [Bacteroidales bacterium]